MIETISNLLKCLKKDIVGNWSWDGFLKGNRSYRITIEIVSDEEESDDDGNNDIPVLDTPDTPLAEEEIPAEIKISEKTAIEVDLVSLNSITSLN